MVSDAGSRQSKVYCITLHAVWGTRSPPITVLSTQNLCTLEPWDLRNKGLWARSSKVIPPSGLSSMLLVKLYLAVPSGETVIFEESPRTAWLNSARTKVTGVSPLKPFCGQKHHITISDTWLFCISGSLYYPELNIILFFSLTSYTTNTNGTSRKSSNKCSSS